MAQAHRRFEDLEAVPQQLRMLKDPKHGAFSACLASASPGREVGTRRPWFGRRVGKSSRLVICDSLDVQQKRAQMEPTVWNVACYYEFLRWTLEKKEEL